MRTIAKFSRSSERRLSAGTFAFRSACLFLVGCMFCMLLLISPGATPPALAQADPGTYIAGQILSGLASGAMSGLFDLFAGHDDTQKILDELSKIEGMLDAISAQLKDIEGKLDQLWKQLAIDTTKMEQRMSELRAQTAIDNIKAAYDTRLIGLANRKPSKITGAELSQFASDFHNYDVHVNTLASCVVPDVSGEGVLDLWVDAALLGQQMQGKTASSDFAALVESTNGVPIVAERPMYFNYQSDWTGGDSASGQLEAGPRFYFAEGCTRPEFDTYFCLMNPNLEQVDVKITYMRGDGTSEEQVVSVPGFTRYTVDAESVLGVNDGPAGDFSAIVESTKGEVIVAERPTYFNYNGSWEGGAVDVGCMAPQERFFFAEGTTRPDFETFICLMNPGDVPAQVTVTYRKADSTSAEQSVTVPARTRSTLRASDLLGSSDDISCDFSTVVESTNGVPIVAERPMYFNYKGQYSGGHSETGLIEPAEKFYLAEGTTRPGFHSFVCLYNLNDSATDVKITYLKGDDTTEEQVLSVPPHTRSTVKVNDILGSADSASCDFSTVVESLSGKPIVAERPMYFNYGGIWEGGSCETGVTEPAEVLLFAEGTARNDFDSYLCLQNPDDRDAQVEITYLKGDGTIEQQRLTVPAHSRRTVNSNNDVNKDLMDYYTDLEMYFYKFISWQVKGVSAVTYSRDYALKHEEGQYGRPEDYQKAYLQQQWAQTDRFIHCVERLVLANAELGRVPSSNFLPDKGQDVLARADRFCDRLLYWGNDLKKQHFKGDAKFPSYSFFGLRGRAIGTEGMFDSQKNPPALTARDKADNTKTYAGNLRPYYGNYGDGFGKSAYLDQYSVPAGKTYDYWYSKDDKTYVKPLSGYHVARYDFGGNIPAGSYDILDASGNVVAGADVANVHDPNMPEDMQDYPYGGLQWTTRSGGTDMFMWNNGWQNYVLKNELKADWEPRALSVSQKDDNTSLLNMGMSSARSFYGLPEYNGYMWCAGARDFYYEGDGAKVQVNFDVEFQGQAQLQSQSGGFLFGPYLQLRRMEPEQPAAWWGKDAYKINVDGHAGGPDWLPYTDTLVDASGNKAVPLGSGCNRFWFGVNYTGFAFFGLPGWSLSQLDLTGNCHLKSAYIEFVQ